MPQVEITLAAHLMRRAGFGFNNDELEMLATKPYEEIVDDLVHPERFSEVDEYALRRYFLQLNNFDTVITWQGAWVYRMVNTRRPLEEKMTLFWHHVFATSVGKSEHGPSAVKQLETFRTNALGKYEEILRALSQDPAMIFWLDNNENHLGEPNENWGRELLELFSMGVGNYTEGDIKQASRAFTGWTFTQPLPLDPYGRYTSEFLYEDRDHDYSEKEFLGETGQFDGDDIIKIVAKQTATANFIARHLYNFFVKDEPPVPLWQTEPPNDPDAIEQLADTFVQSKYEMKEVLRVLFNSDFFKNALYEKVKSPVEVFVNTIKLSGDLQGDHPEIPLIESVAKEPGYMGQSILDPPSVEGWHTGRGWINSGTLGKRINFVVDRFNDTNLPGISNMVAKISERGFSMSHEELVESCLDLLGPLVIDSETLSEIHEHARSGGEICWVTPEGYKDLSTRIGEILSLIVSTKEYQMN